MRSKKFQLKFTLQHLNCNVNYIGWIVEIMSAFFFRPVSLELRSISFMVLWLFRLFLWPPWISNGTQPLSRTSIRQEATDSVSRIRLTQSITFQNAAKYTLKPWVCTPSAVVAFLISRCLFFNQFYIDSSTRTNTCVEPNEWILALLVEINRHQMNHRGKHRIYTFCMLCIEMAQRLKLDNATVGQNVQFKSKEHDGWEKSAITNIQTTTRLIRFVIFSVEEGEERKNNTHTELET